MIVRKYWFLLELMTLLCAGCAELSGSTPWSLETSFRTEHVLKTGTVLYNKPVIVNKIKRSFGDWYAGAASYTALSGEKYGSTYGDQFDLFGGWNHTFGWLRLDLGASYFLLKNLSTTKDDGWMVDGEVSFPKVPFIEPYFAVRRINEVGDKSPERGWFVWAGMRRSQPLGFRLGKEEATAKIDVSLAYSDGAAGKDPGFVYARGLLGFPIVLYKHLTLTPSVMYQVPIGGQSDNARPYTTQPELIGGVSIRYDFGF